MATGPVALQFERRGGPPRPTHDRREASLTRWTSYSDNGMIRGMNCLTGCFERTRIPFTLILCRIRQRRLADSASPKGRGKGQACFSKISPPCLQFADGMTDPLRENAMNTLPQRDSYTFLRNEANLFLGDLRCIDFRYRNLYGLQQFLHLGSFSENEPNS
jgi:hypothetical protein